MGRKDGQEAVQLFDLIKSRIASSSHAIFDVTGGNANVSLEFGYAEGLGIDKAIYLSNRKNNEKHSSPSTPIISDLGGSRRIQYKNEASLRRNIDEFIKAHSYYKRFEKCVSAQPSKKRSLFRNIAIKIIRQLDGKESIRRDELLSNVTSDKSRLVNSESVDNVIKKLHVSKLINCSVGARSVVRII